MLEEVGVEYELKIYDRDAKTRFAPEAYKSLSPLGVAPVITDDDKTLAESSAIIDYILDKYPNDTLRPSPGSEYRDRYLFWFHAAQGSAMPVMLVDSLFRLIHSSVPFFLKSIIGSVFKQTTAGFSKPRMDALLGLAEADLETAPWFGGQNLTAADIALCYPMEAAHARGYITDEHPNCMAWLERMRAHPSFQRAREKDGRPHIVLLF